MKNIRKFVSLVLIFSLLMSFAVMMPASAAETVRNLDKAQALYTVGLFKGTDKGFELEREMTRAEAAVMMVRLLGKESYAQSASLSHPFTDVPNWASPAVAYLYQNGITKGTGASTYGSTSYVSAQSYTTFALRALGYSEERGDFVWTKALEKAAGIGMLSSERADELKTKTFLRDDAVEISFYALRSIHLPSSQKLIEKLVSDGAVSKDKAIEAGFIAGSSGGSSSTSSMTVTSAGIKDGVIADKYGKRGTMLINKMPTVSIPLTIAGAPAQTHCYALIIEDLDKLDENGEPFINWIATNILKPTIPENASNNLLIGGFIQGRNGYGYNLYGGMYPEDKDHTYKFTVYALSASVPVYAGFSKETFLEKSDGLILSSVSFTAIYKK